MSTEFDYPENDKIVNIVFLLLVMLFGISYQYKPGLANKKHDMESYLSVTQVICLTLSV